MIRLQINENLTEAEALAHAVGHLMSHSWLSARKLDTDPRNNLQEFLVEACRAAVSAYTEDPEEQQAILEMAVELGFEKYQLPLRLKELLTR